MVMRVREAAGSWPVSVSLVGGVYGRCRAQGLSPALRRVPPYYYTSHIKNQKHFYI